jgi:hypothetical protein
MEGEAVERAVVGVACRRYAGEDTTSFPCLKLHFRKMHCCGRGRLVVGARSSGGFEPLCVDRGPYTHARARAMRATPRPSASARRATSSTRVVQASRVLALFLV